MVTPAKVWTTSLRPLLVGVSRADPDLLRYDPQDLTTGRARVNWSPPARELGVRGAGTPSALWAPSTQAPVDE